MANGPHTYKAYWQCKVSMLEDRPKTSPKIQRRGALKDQDALLKLLRPSSSQATLRPQGGSLEVSLRPGTGGSLAGLRQSLGGSQKLDGAVGTLRREVEISAYDHFIDGFSRVHEEKPRRTPSRGSLAGRADDEDPPPNPFSLYTPPWQSNHAMEDHPGLPRHAFSSPGGTATFGTKPLEEESDDLLGKTQAEIDRARKLLLKAKFFASLHPDVLDEMPAVSSFSKEPEGAVIFRKGDLPKSCWLIVRGQVGFYVNKEDSKDNSPRHPVTDGYENQKVPFGWEDRQRVFTLEGFSTWNLQTKLGKCVGKAGPGDLFGELALFDDSVRKASARCLTNCEFLLVPASAFKAVKEKLLEEDKTKKIFLAQHVPGFRECPIPGPNDPPYPSFYFHKVVMQTGHEFIRQGSVTPGVIYVLCRGTLDVRRHKKLKFDPASGLMTFIESEVSGEADEIVDVVSAGSLFGSCPQGKTQEPFTYVATSRVEVFKVNTKDLDFLPPGLLHQIQHHLSCLVSQRLKYSCVHRHFGWERRHNVLYSRRRRQVAVKPEKDYNDSIVKELEQRDLNTGILAGRCGEALHGFRH